MNKVMAIWLVLFLGLSYQAFAKAGAPNDGLLFELAIVSFLLLATGFFAGLEYLKKRGKDHFH